MNSKQAIATFYHRSQRPWVAQSNDGKIAVMLRIAKGVTQEISVVFCDSQNIGRPNERFYAKQQMQMVGETTLHELWRAEIFVKAKRYRYGFVVRFADQSAHLGEAGILDSEYELCLQGKGFTYAYWNQVNFLNTPEWYRKTSWYQIFPDRFAKKNKRDSISTPWNKLPKSHETYGGDILGIIEKLPYIKGLGFTGIYMTPIFASPSSHRYDTTDYYRIDPVLGTEHDFEQLIKQAHSLGLRVMLDAVFNHIGASSEQWQSVLRHGKESPYADWFWINDWSKVNQGHTSSNEFAAHYPYETFSVVKQMPRLNWNNPQVCEYLLNAAIKWTSYGIDGWRLDVSFEPPLRFWRKFKQAVKAENSDIVIVGEVWWDSIDWIDPEVWDGVMNYQLREILVDYFTQEWSIDAARRLVFRFNEVYGSYAPEQCWGMFNLLSSHDTPRMITLLKNDVDKYKAAMRLLLALPGASSTYYGEEIAMEGSQDPDNRRTFPENPSVHELQEFFKRENYFRGLNTLNVDIHKPWWAHADHDGTITISNGITQLTVKGHEVSLVNKERK